MTSNTMSWRKRHWRSQYGTRTLAKQMISLVSKFQSHLKKGILMYVTLIMDF